MDEIRITIREPGGRLASSAVEKPQGALLEARVIDWIANRVDYRAQVLIIDPADRPWPQWALHHWMGSTLYAKITVARPQRDELRIPRLRNYPTVAIDLDTWPLVDGVSTIYEEMLAWSFGPIWASYRDESHPLVQQFLTNAAPAAAA